MTNADRNQENLIQAEGPDVETAIDDQTGESDGPPVDGGVVGGVPGRASIPGATEAVGAADGELPPEEHGR